MKDHEIGLRLGCISATHYRFKEDAPMKKSSSTEHPRTIIYSVAQMSYVTIEDELMQKSFFILKQKFFNTTMWFEVNTMQECKACII